MVGVNPEVAHEHMAGLNFTHFDAHAYRTADAADVRTFAAGCMRTYLILKEKAEQFAEDAEIQGLLAELAAADRADAVPADVLAGPYSAEHAKALQSYAFDRKALGRRGRPYERLDQLTTELLLGVR